MADFPTRLDLFRIARDEILFLNAKISREVVERGGSDANILVNAGVAMAEECIGQLTEVCAGQFLASAEDEALDKLVFDRYGLVRKPAAPSLGTVAFRTTALTAAAFTIPVGTKLQTATGVQFITTLATTFPVNSSGPVFVPIRSLLAGVEQQAKIGAITSITSTITGSPADLVVTNEFATAGAADEESDDELRDRARRFFTTARRGTTGAIEAGALAVPGVVRATAVEVIDAKGRAGRLVQLVIADQFTEAFATLDVDDPAYELQSQTLATVVFNALSDVRAGGIFVHVVVGQIILLPVQLALTFAAGVQTDEVALAARARIVNFVNELSPGTTFDPDAAVDALRSVNGLIITGSEIVSPAGDVVPRTVQVLRTSLDLVNATAVQTGQPIALTTNPDEYLFNNPPVTF